MRFWDASALVPVCLEEPGFSETARKLFDQDGGIAAWWGSVVECWSAFARLRRDGLVTDKDEAAARAVLARLQDAWLEVAPGDSVRVHAGRLLRTYVLRAGDALQLAAALVWAGSPPTGEMVTFDDRLAEVARVEGLTSLP